MGLPSEIAVIGRVREIRLPAVTVVGEVVVGGPGFGVGAGGAHGGRPSHLFLLFHYASADDLVDGRLDQGAQMVSPTPPEPRAAVQTGGCRRTERPRQRPRRRNSEHKSSFPDQGLGHVRRRLQQVEPAPAHPGGGDVRDAFGDGEGLRQGAAPFSASRSRISLSHAVSSRRLCDEGPGLVLTSSISSSASRTSLLTLMPRPTGNRPPPFSARSSGIAQMVDLRDIPSRWPAITPDG